MKLHACTHILFVSESTDTPEAKFGKLFSGFVKKLLLMYYSFKTLLDYFTYYYLVSKLTII